MPCLPRPASFSYMTVVSHPLGRSGADPAGPTPAGVAGHRPAYYALGVRRKARIGSQPGIEHVLGPLAGPIMRIVIERGEATVGMVAADLADGRPHAPAYTTVMTILGRLHERGLLDRRKEGRGYVYRPAADEQDTLERLSGQAVDRLLDKYGTSAMRRFAIRLGDVDPDLRNELISLAGVRKVRK